MSLVTTFAPTANDLGLAAYRSAGTEGRDFTPYFRVSGRRYPADLLASDIDGDCIRIDRVLFEPKFSGCLVLVAFGGLSTAHARQRRLKSGLANNVEGEPSTRRELDNRPLCGCIATPK